MELTVFNTYYLINIQLKYLSLVMRPEGLLDLSARYFLKLVIKTTAYIKTPVSNTGYQEELCVE